MITAKIGWGVTFALLLLFKGQVLATEKAQTKANVMEEWTFTAAHPHPDPFNDVRLDVIFADPSGRELRVPAFWAGTNLWKVRYASPLTGIHRFRSECSDTNDSGLHGVAGSVEVTAYDGENPLFRHGPLKVSKNRRHFEHSDGTPFFWLGDTWWMGLSARLHWPDDVKTLAKDRKTKGFNVIQMVAGLFPDMFPFDPRGVNEGGHPWQTNYSSIRPEYFDEADKRIFYLVDQGVTPCIFGAWGYFMQWMGVKKCEEHWRYLVARYGALPVVWGIAGEANLPWYLAKGFPYDDREQVKGWTEVARYLRNLDPFHRLTTIHPTGIGRLSARHAIDDVSLIDFDMLQTPHGRRDAVVPTVKTVRQSYSDTPVMPVINGEASFEMLGDNLPTEWTRRMFWLCMMNGAAGHTYGANGIWQVNRRGDPHGPSPHHHGGFGYGKIPWDEAMNLPGSEQVGFGKKLFEEFQWEKFQPHPEWVSFTDTLPLSFEGAKWIWFPEGEPAKNAPAEKRFFRKTFVLPDGVAVGEARARITADDRFTAWMNGERIGAAEGWGSGGEFHNFSRWLRGGTNVLVIEAENVAAPSANPAGFIARLEMKLANGQAVKLDSDASWVSSRRSVPDWKEETFDDQAWKKAVVVAAYGDAPWGRLESQESNEFFGPQSTGIPGVVRLIYVPERRPVKVNTLSEGLSYFARWFDPVTGGEGVFPAVKNLQGESWICEPPPGMDHDWVLILEASGAK